MLYRKTNSKDHGCIKQYNRVHFRKVTATKGEQEEEELILSVSATKVLHCH